MMGDRERGNDNPKWYWLHIKIHHHHIGCSAPSLSQVIKSKLNFRRWCVLRNYLMRIGKALVSWDWKTPLSGISFCISGISGQMHEIIRSVTDESLATSVLACKFTDVNLQHEDLNWHRLFFLIFKVNYTSSLKTPLCMLLGLIFQQILKSMDWQGPSSWTSVYTFLVLVLKEPL